MTFSLNNRQLARLSGSACLLALLVAARVPLAAAQDAAAPEAPPRLTEQLLDPNETPLARSAGPKSLLPPVRGQQRSVTPPPFEDAGQPEVFFPSGQAAPLPPLEPAQDLAARPGEEGTGIEVARLSTVADEGLGLIGPVEGGLSPMLWSGSRRLTIEDGLASLAPPPPSPALGYLYRRLLISRGEMPQGASAGRSILGLRLEALHAAGFAREITRLASLLPNGDLTVETAAPAARAALARREVEDACSYLTHLPAEGGPGDTYAQFALELGTLCQARAGLEMAALLSVDLVREFAPGDTAFVALATRAAGGPALDVPNDEVFTGLHLALSEEASVPLPADIADRAEPALLAPLASDASLDWDTRLRIAEMAAARALIGPLDLADIYRQASVAGATDTNPRASAFAVALDAPDQVTRLGAIAAAYAETPVGDWPATLPAFTGSLQAIAPNMAHADNAVFMTEALALLGDAARADGWIGIVAASAPAQTARLETLVRIAARGQSAFVAPWNPDIALKSIDVRLQGGDTNAKWLTAFEMQTLAALGYPVPQVVWAQFDDREMPGIRLEDSALRALRVAAEGRRAGEAALAALNSVSVLEQGGDIGMAGPWALTPGSLAAIMTALSRSGLEDDARRIAVEALIARAHGAGAP